MIKNFMIQNMTTITIIINIRKIVINKIRIKIEISKIKMNHLKVILIIKNNLYFKN